MIVEIIGIFVAMWLVMEAVGNTFLIYNQREERWEVIGSPSMAIVNHFRKVSKKSNISKENFPKVYPDGGNYTAFKCECGQSLDGSGITGVLHFFSAPHNLSQAEAEKAWNWNVERMNNGEI